MRVVYKNLVLYGKETDLVCEDGWIVSTKKTRESGTDCHGYAARAGLFDTHCHGCMGRDTMDMGAKAMASALGKRGVTSFLPTTMTMPKEEITAVCQNLPAWESGDAKIRGVHLEGPFIAKERCGAQDPAYIQTPNEALLDACPKATLITVAPEQEGAIDFIAAASARGVRVSLGHTDADYETAVRAFQSGASCLTHTFNAMPPLSHRAPGPIGAALTEDGYVQVICDGVHIHRAAILALYRMFGAERMILISDMMSATGLSDGTYSLGGQAVFVKGNRATLASGVLAGSATFLDDCVRTAISFGIPCEDAFEMASKTPAAMMGLPIGVLKEGYEADFGIYDQSNRLLRTVIGGI